jgi:rubrerythrin
MAKKSTKKTSEMKSPKAEPKPELFFWRCTVCGWITPEKQAFPPEVCPACGAPKEDFEKVID